MKSPRPSALRATSAATLLLLGTCAALPLNAWAAPFASGNVVAYRVGSEANAKSVYLAEYRVDGSLVQRIALTSTDAAQSLAASSTTSEGLLTRSPDGRCLAVPGYKAIAGSADPKKATASQANRAVKLVDASGAGLGDLLGLGTAAFNKDAIRSAISNDCASAWASGKGDTTPNGGIWFKGAGNAAALLPGNTQGLAIADGQLLVSVAGGGKLSQVGNNLPTSGTPSITQLSGMPVNNFRGIAFARLGQGSGAADTLYAAANDADQIQKYIRSGGTWTPSGSVALAGAHGLAVYATGDGNALLLASDGAGTLYQWFDASGATGILQGAPNVIATLPAGEAFYGLALAPESTLPASPPAAPTQVRLTTQSGNDATLQWTAPVSGPAVAFYVVEVSQNNFTTVTQSAVATTPHLTLTGLPSGAQKIRVRAVNSVGGSASALSADFVVGSPPTTSLPDNSALSGTAGDINDALATQGLRFNATDSANGVVTVTATSSDQTVVADAGIQITNDNGNATLRITPTKVGYADIVVTLTASNRASITRTIRYAASANTAATPSTRWFAGRSDGSSALMLPSGEMLVADDEAPAKDASGNALSGGNAIFGYQPQTGGLPVSQLVPDGSLGLSNTASCSNGGFSGLANCKADGEVDLESSFIVGDRMYFAGSHSNNKNGRSRPDRWRFFAVDAASGKVSGYYQWLREDLRNWDQKNLHGMGADYLGLVASSDGGDNNPLKAPETDTLSGFSIEGSTTSPDDAQLWLGFRAPLVSAPGQSAVEADKATNRTHALVIPVTNYAALPGASGGSKNSATFGAPVRLDLGGRGIREIRKNANGEYLIIAGPPNGANGSAPRDFRLFSWDGRVSSNGLLALNVRQLAADVAAFTPPRTACSAEGIGTLPAALAQGGAATIVSDCGDADFYGDGKAAKDLGFAAWKKFRSDSVNIAALPVVTLAQTATTQSGADFSAQGTQTGMLHAVVLAANAPVPSWEQVKAGQGATGEAALWSTAGIALTAGEAARLNVSGLAADTAFVAYAIVVSADGVASLVAPTAFRTGAGATTPVIQWGDLPARALGSAPFTVSATGNASNNPVQFASSTPGVCQSSGANGASITLLAVGTCTIRATQAGTAGSPDAAPVQRSFPVQLPAATGSTLPGGDGGSATVTGNGWQFADNSVGPVSAGSMPPLPNGYRFVQPTGFGFVLVGGSSSVAARVTWQWTQPAPAAAMLWKFGPTAGNATPHWYDAKAQFNGARTSGSFSLTDGADGDADRLVNGVIVDPVFLVEPTAITEPSNPASVPTLSEIARTLLALALAGFAALSLRRRAP